MLENIRPFLILRMLGVVEGEWSNISKPAF